MEVIGERFADGQAFIPELIMAGEIMQGVTAELKPYLKAEATGEKLGTVVMCTVQGDIHDIGKDIVVTMLDIAGFNVVDLGVDVPIAKVVDAVRDNKAQVLGLSGLLTVAFESMKATVAAVEEAGLRGEVKIMLGGAPVTDAGRGVRRRRRLGQGRGRRGRAGQGVGGGCVRCCPTTGTSSPPKSGSAFRLDAWQNVPVEFASPEVAQTYRDTVQLYPRRDRRSRSPRRVPIAPWIGLLPFRFYGYTGHDAYYDYDKFQDAWFRFHDETRPDGIGLTLGIVPGKLFDVLDYKLYDWPGHGTPEDSSYQYTEKEWMKADEYDHLIQDPCDYWLRSYLPRMFGAMEPWTHAAAVDRPRRDPVHGAVLRGLLGPAGQGDAAEADGRRRRRHGVAAGVHGRSTARSWRPSASRRLPAAPPRPPTTSSATPCAARAG